MVSQRRRLFCAFSLSLLLLPLGAVTSRASAQTLYLTENKAYSSAGPQPGFMLAVFNAMAKVLNKPVTIQFMGWTDAQTSVRTGKNGVIFPFTRTPAREANYGWLLKFWDLKEGFVVIKGHPVIDSFADAAALPSVAVVGGSSQDSLLSAQHLTNLVRVSSANDLAAAVAEGKVAAGYGTSVEIKYGWVSQKLPGVGQFGKSLSVNPQWMGMSKNSPDLVPEDWQQAFEAVQQDGTFDQLYSQYFGARDE